MAINNIETLYKIMMEGKAKNPNFSGEEALARLMKQRLQEVLSDLMGVEMEHFLGFKKNEQGAAKARGNSRNGSYKRKITSIAGDMQIDVPRDRNAEFETMLFEAHKQNSNKIVSDVLKMYSEGLTETQIQAIIEKIYDKKLSKSCISDMVDVVIEDIQKFQNRPLQEKYFAIFCDSTYVPLRRKTVDKEAINIVIGIDMKGYPEVLAYSITPEEHKTSWEDLFIDITKRGVKSSMILISDGFVGISELVKSYLPGCLHQRCFIHLARNLGDKVRKEHRAAITNEFMYLAKQLDMKHAIERFYSFVERWSKIYPSIQKWANNIDHNTIFNFYKFPGELRKCIYTNNRAENIMKEIKRNAKQHIQFPTEESEHKFLVSRFNIYNMRVGKRQITNWQYISMINLD